MSVEGVRRGPVVLAALFVDCGLTGGILRCVWVPSTLTFLSDTLFVLYLLLLLLLMLLSIVLGVSVRINKYRGPHVFVVQ